MKEEPFYPRHFWKTISVLLLVVVLIVLLAALAPFGFGRKVNPIETPEGIRPEWYLVGAYQFLKFFPKEFGVLLILIFCIAFCLFPLFIRRHTKFAIFVGWVILGAFILLTLLGYIIK
jgi:quinol-cytochrome oxidoreductase complex cytochrome b subunit